MQNCSKTARKFQAKLSMMEYVLQRSYKVNVSREQQRKYRQSRQFRPAEIQQRSGVPGLPSHSHGAGNTRILTSSPAQNRTSPAENEDQRANFCSLCKIFFTCTHIRRANPEYLHSLKTVGSWGSAINPVWVHLPLLNNHTLRSWAVTRDRYVWSWPPCIFMLNTPTTHWIILVTRTNTWTASILHCHITVVKTSSDEISNCEQTERYGMPHQRHGYQYCSLH